MKVSTKKRNRFLALKWYEFIVVQVFVLAFFPVSLFVVAVAFGQEVARELAEALIKDWLQTIALIVILFLVILSGAIWGLSSWLG